MVSPVNKKKEMRPMTPMTATMRKNKSPRGFLSLSYMIRGKMIMMGSWATMPPMLRQVEREFLCWGSRVMTDCIDPYGTFTAV